MATIWTAILSAVGTGIFGALCFLISKIVKFMRSLLDDVKEIKTTVDKVNQNDVRRARQMGALFKATSYMSKAMACNSKAIRATLEVVAGIKNNGNVKEAIDCMDEYDADMAKGDEVIENYNREEAWTA